MGHCNEQNGTSEQISESDGRHFRSRSKENQAVKHTGKKRKVSRTSSESALEMNPRCGVRHCTNQRLSMSLCVCACHCVSVCVCLSLSASACAWLKVF